MTTARSRSGSYVHEAQRHTSRVVLRLRPEVADRLRAAASAAGMTLAEYVTALVEPCAVPELGGDAACPHDLETWRHTALGVMRCPVCAP